MLAQLQETSQPNFSISSKDSKLIVDLGQVATVDKFKRDTVPLDLPTSFGEVVHLDILFGAGVAHGGTKYTLYPVDRATRYKMIYPLTNLGDDMFQQLQNFCND